MNRFSLRRGAVAAAVGAVIEPLEPRALFCAPGDFYEIDAVNHATAQPAALIRPTPAGPAVAAVSADPAVAGQWSAVRGMDLVPIHATVLPTGKVMYWDFTTVKVYDPVLDHVSTLNNAGYVVFCSGHAQLGDGNILVSGGQASGGDGLINASIYNPLTNQWTRQPDMNERRWYPTNTTLANGDVLTVSGDYFSGVTNPDGSKQRIVNPLPQVFGVATNTWRNLTSAERKLPLYPFMFVAPNGRIFNAGPQQMGSYLDTSATGAWTDVAASSYGYRSYGSAVMYEPGKVMIVGGSRETSIEPPTATAEVIDLNAASPAWRSVSSMHFARRMHTATILPNGTVLATGGTSAAGFNNSLGSVYNAEVWDPNTGEWTLLAAASVRRIYHSTAVLLPDGRVMSMGGGHPADTAHGDTNHPDAEIFSPPYLFKPARPTITSAPGMIAYGGAFSVTTPDAASIADVTLVRLGSVTHGIDMDQRFERLKFTRTATGLAVAGPAGTTTAPPGSYMLFILDDQGVPSVAKIVRVGATKAPIIGSLADTPDPVTVGGSVTLTANSVADSDGFVSRVEFFRETNGTSGLQLGTGGDALVGANTSSSGGWTATFSTAGVVAKTYTYYARAIDNLGVGGLTGTAAIATTNTVKVPSTTTKIIVRAAADAYVYGRSASTNFGSSNQLLVKNASSAKYRRETYLKFSLSTVATVGSAKLRVYGRLHANDNGIPVAVYVSSNTGWTEPGLTYSNRPPTSDAALDSVTVTGTSGEWYEFDVTSDLAVRKAAGAAFVTLVFNATLSSGAYVVFNSDEASSNKPQLVVTPAPALPDVQPERRAAADAYVRNGKYTSRNYGSSSELLVRKTSDANYEREAYLRFDLSGVDTVAAARLRLYGRRKEAGRDVGTAVYGAGAASWAESGITWANKPAATTGILASHAVSGTTGRWYEYDLTPYVQQQKAAGATSVTFILRATVADPTYLLFNADEAALNRPGLVITP